MGAMDYESGIKSAEIEIKGVEEYYAETLNTNEDLKTNACCITTSFPTHIKECFKSFPPVVMEKSYGCGVAIPDCLEGCTVLDLGCGAGRDCFICAKLVGEEGKVVGIDMTREMISNAEVASDKVMEGYGYSKKNVEFVTGFIESIDTAITKQEWADVVISNCVVNLSPDKRSVMQQAFKALKYGGEMYFSDVYSSSRVPSALRKDKDLVGECLSGALYWNDFIRLAKEVGFGDPRLVSDTPIAVTSPALKKLLPDRIGFYSATYRLIKLKPDQLEPDCEDYGQAVVYKGTMKYRENSFILDAHHEFHTGKIMTVCSNTFNMLHETRYKEHFEFFGDTTVHFGIFDGCGKNIPFASAAAGPGAGGGSCC